MLSLFKKKSEELANKYSGRVDVLEGIVAAKVLTAAAEGGIDKDEELTMRKLCYNSKLLSSFDRFRIDKTIDSFCDKIETGGRAVKREMLKEIEEAVTKDPSLGEVILLGALDIAEAGDGTIGDKEAKILDDISAVCGVKSWRDMI